MQLQKPCSECPVINESIISENTQQFSSVQDFLTGILDSEHTLSCHKFTDWNVDSKQTDDPPLCKGAMQLREKIYNDFK